MKRSSSLLVLLAFAAAACGDSLPDNIDRSELTSSGTHFASSRMYVNLGPAGCSQPELSCDVELTLCSSGQADYFAGGDILYRYSYQIDGNDLILSADDTPDLHFYIVDNESLEAEDGGSLTKTSPPDDGVCGATP